MMRTCFTWNLAWVCLVLGGCSRRGDVDLLETRLRQQEDRLRQLQSRLSETESELSVSRREAETLRKQLAEHDKVILPEQSDSLFRTTGIRINSLLTGGLDQDGELGDEMLSVVLVPHDQDGEPVKVAGRIEFELLDLSRSDVDQSIGRWTFSPDESRRHWQSGFIGSGYQFDLPWQRVPQNSKLLLHARLQTSDGRQFDTSATVRITPPVLPDGGYSSTAREESDADAASTAVR